MNLNLDQNWFLHETRLDIDKNKWSYVFGLKGLLLPPGRSFASDLLSLGFKRQRCSAFFCGINGG